MATKTDTVHINDLAKSEHPVAKANAKSWDKVTKAKRTKSKKPAKAKAKVAKPAQGRADSKQARFIAAMRTAKGMSITEAAKAFDWQKHTVRGAIAGAIKVRLGLKVDAEQDEKRGTVYRIKK